MPTMTLQTYSDTLQKFVSHLPSLSTTMTKVIEICNNPESTPSLLKQVIALDPVLTGSVIKLVNSAYCGFSNQVTSLTRAIILLGVNTVKNMAMAISILGIVQQKRLGQVLDMDRFWAHSLAVGGIAKAIARLLNLPRSDIEIHFVAGLLHDLGKLPLMACFPERYAQAVSTAAEGAFPLFEAESRLFGMDHAFVGHMIAGKWRLDPPICRAIADHHHPLPLVGPDDFIRATVGLANAVAYQFEFGGAGNQAQGPMSLTSLAQALELDPVLLADMKPQIEMEIEKAKIFLQLTA